jgi:hypothetical protein
MFSGKCSESTEKTGDGGSRILKSLRKCKKTKGRKFTLSSRPQKYAKVKEKEGLTWTGK